MCRIRVEGASELGDDEGAARGGGDAETVVGALADDPKDGA